jgi:transposase
MIQTTRRGEEAAGMALSVDLRKRVVEAVVHGGLSRNAAAKRFGVSIASTVRWLQRFNASGKISPVPTGGDRRSGRIEAHRDYLMGLIRRQPDITLLEIQERLIANCGERFSSSVIWRFEELIRAAGAELRYLPPYSPDLNPIEKAYSKLKAFLRKIAERTVAGLMNALDACAEIFKPTECVNYFRACGYDTD